MGITSESRSACPGIRKLAADVAKLPEVSHEKALFQPCDQERDGIERMRVREAAAQAQAGKPEGYTPGAVSGHFWRRFYLTETNS
jgi:hypothetical protein